MANGMSKHAVLIVDDNVDAANVLALGVRAFGHEAQTASSGVVIARYLPAAG